ncbi:MAG TPA: ABC transporter permease [Candidatus Methylomirabilis sp.]|nr:ABC transporter permease [Candidatus Methylomirabilis sp.]
MKTYLLRRVLAVVPVMLVVATVSFVLIRLAPGDPASVLAGPDASADDLAVLRVSLGIDQPLPLQLVRWYARLAHGDLGQSIFLRRPVGQAIVERLEPTILLTVWGTLLSVLIGVPAGIVSARRHGTAVDQSFMALALVGLSIPNFLLGLLMILVFGVWLGWLPVSGYVPLDEGLWRNVRSLLMPAMSLGLVQSALVARITRSSMLDVLREQYILSGRAKGLHERAVVYKHALKNAIIPTITVIGITVALLIGGAVVIETVFNIPGVGRLIISAVLRRDYPVVQGVVLMIALTYTMVNLLVDLAYLVIDPRIRYTGPGRSGP